MAPDWLPGPMPKEDAKSQQAPQVPWWRQMSPHALNPAHNIPLQAPSTTRSSRTGWDSSPARLSPKP